MDSMNSTERTAQICEEKFKATIDFLYNKKNKQGIPLLDLPWVLSFGTDTVDTAFILEKLEAQFILKPKNIGGTYNYCSWWITQEYVLLDINWRYFMASDKALWLHFVKLLNAQKTLKKMQLWFFIDIFKFLEKKSSNVQYIIEDYRYFFQTLAQTFKTVLPLYLIAGNVARVQGFSDFFDMESQTVIAETLGLHFFSNEMKSKQIFIENFDKKYNQFLQTLHDRVIEKLHHEKILKKRMGIKEFPLQMEGFKKSLLLLLIKLLFPKNAKFSYVLKNIFFIGYLDRAEAQDILHLPFEKTFHFPVLPKAPPSALYKQYFLEKLPQQLLENEVAEVLYRSNWRYFLRWTQYFVLPLTIIFCLTTGAFLSKKYFLSSHELTNVQRFIGQYELLQNLNHTHNLNLQILALDQLKKAYFSAAQMKLDAFLTTANFDYELIVLRQNYETALQQTFDKLMANAIGVALSESPVNYTRLYEILYLQQLFKQEFVGLKNTKATIENLIFTKNILAIQDPRTLALLKPALQQVFERRIPLAISTATILQAKQAFNTLSVPSYVNFMLGIALNGTLSIKIKNIPSQMQVLNVPEIYTKDKFQMIYDMFLPQLIQKLSQTADPVTGIQLPDTSALPDVLLSIRDQYVHDYTVYWENFIMETAQQLGPVETEKTSTQLQLRQDFEQIKLTDPTLAHFILYNTAVTYHAVATPISEYFSILTGDAMHN